MLLELPRVNMFPHKVCLLKEAQEKIDLRLDDNYCFFRELVENLIKFKLTPMRDSQISWIS